MTFLGGPQSGYRYPAVITHVSDGDTVGATLTLVLADVGFGVTEKNEISFSRMRLAGMDAPETSTQAGKDAKAHIESLLGPLPAVVWITTTKDKADNFGRYLATITLRDGTNVNQKMIDDGYAEVYPKPKTESESK